MSPVKSKLTAKQAVAVVAGGAVIVIGVVLGSLYGLVYLVSAAWHAGAHL